MSEMRIKVNGEECFVPLALTVDKLLTQLGYRDVFVAVAVNRRCILRTDFYSHRVNGGDEIEILAPMAGG